MKPTTLHTARVLLGALLLATPAAAQEHAVFRVTLPADTALTRGAPVSGRLIVMMSATRPPPGRPLTPFSDDVWVAAREVRGLRPGASVEIDADSLAAPRPFSASPAGKRYVAAMLDVDHNANWAGPAEGDLVTHMDSVQAMGTRAAPFTLALAARVGPTSLPSPPRTQLVELESPRLSAFWRRPVKMRAVVILPPDSEAIATPAGPRFRAVYHVPGWGGTYRMGFIRGQRQVEMMRAAGERGAAHVYLDPEFPTGHPVFANSAVNGPWADALMRDLVPHLEGRFHLMAEPRGRFLTGHSSGGWSTLWLQTSAPDFWGGTWSTSPDPVDFAEFNGLDMRPGSRDNYYRRADGTPRPFFRVGGQARSTLEAFVRSEMVTGPGGQQQSFEAVFGPRGRDGGPVPAFDRETGVLNQAVLRAWSAYDIRANLQRDWGRVGPRLRGKLHLWVGGDDTFYLTGPTQRLCAFLRGAGSDATCEVVPGRDHFNLYQAYDTYPQGLEARIGAEMQRTFDASR